MSDNPYNRNASEHRFDTLSLLAGLNESDMESFSLEDILREFSNPKNNEDNTERSEDMPPQSADTQTSNKDENDFVTSIQQAIDHEMEITQGLPDPVIIIEDSEPIHQRLKDEKLPDTEEPDQDDSESILRKYGFRLVQKIENSIPDEIPAENMNVVAQDEEPSWPVVTQPTNTNSKPVQEVKKQKALRKKHGLKNKIPKNDTLREGKADTSAPAENATTVPAVNTQGNSTQPIRLQIKEVDAYLPGTEDEDEENEVTLNNNRHAMHEAGVPSVEEAVHRTGKEFKQNQTAMSITMLLALVSCLLTVVYIYGLSDESFIANAQKLSLILLGVMLLAVLCSWRAILKGIKDISALRISRNVLLIAALLITAVAALTCKAGDNLAPCALTCLDIFFMQWGATLSSLGRRRTLKTVEKEHIQLSAINSIEQAHNNSRAIVKSAYDEKSFLRNLLTEDFSDKFMTAYSAFIIVLSLVLAFVLNGQKGYGLFWCWSLLISLGLPLGSFISNTRPFAILATSLSKHDCAVAGWNGAKDLYQSRYFILRDEDLFNRKQVKMGGVKLYRALSMGQVASYAAAIMELAGCGLSPLFAELRDANRGRVVPITQFRRYEGGGYGAKAAGDVVLIGSQRFMQLMGIRMETASKIPGAVYMSVNSALAAVFVLNYSVTPKLKRAVMRLRDSGRVQSLAATRDFMLTPKMLEQYFKLPPEKLDFPSAERRNQLADLGNSKNGSCCAVTGSAAFTAFINVYIAAVRLYRQIVISVYISAITGVMGTVMAFLMLYVPKTPNINCFGAEVIAVLLALPVLVISGIRKK